MLILLTTTFVKAQTQKGNQLLGGNIGFGITNQNTVNNNITNSVYNYSFKSKTTNYSIGPVYSYFIADNLDLGASVNYSQQKTTYNYSVANTTYNVLPDNINTKNFSAGIYLRKYFLYQHKIGVRTGPSLQYTEYKSNYQYLGPQSFNDDQIGKQVNAGLILDLVYFPIKKLGLISSIGSLGYTHISNHNNSSSYNEDDKINAFGFSLVSNLNLSIVYCFGK